MRGGRFAAAGAMALVFLALDAVWLSQTNALIYKPTLGPILYSGGARLVPAVLFYLIYFIGLMSFAVGPALSASTGWPGAARRGGLFGFCAYATYDLTNQATLALWSTKITALDLIWGTVVSAIAAIAGYLAGARFASRP